MGASQACDVKENICIFLSIAMTRPEIFIFYMKIVSYIYNVLCIYVRSDLHNLFKNMHMTLTLAIH